MQAATFGYNVTFLTEMNLSDCTALRIIIGRPADSGLGSVSHELNVTTAITDKPHGVVNWIPADGDLPVPGTYEVQIVDHTPGRVVSTDIGRFYVNENIDTLGTTQTASAVAQAALA